MIRFSITLVVLMLVLLVASKAQVKNDIYYFSVGSGHYEKDRKALEKGFYGLPDVLGAVESAKRVKALFDDMGAVGGEVLVSEDFNFVTRKKLFDGLDKSIQQAKAMKVPNLLFVFYYCGHGFTNGELQAMFIPPGDIAKDLNNFSYEDWLDQTISPVEIKEKLEEAGLRYMILMDCCYEGENKTIELLNPQLVKLTGFETMDQLMKDTYKIIIAMNQMIGPDPTIFSTLSGESVKLVGYDFKEGKREIGPLCYRMHEIVNESLKDMDITLSDFVVMIKSAELDGKTQEAVSYWRMEDNAWNYLRK